MTTIKLESEYATEIFINGNNTITIKQTNDVETETVVFASKSRVRQVIDSLNKLAESASFEPETEEEE